MSSKQVVDVVVVGGGVIGCAIAYYLQKAGIQATVLERGEIGGQASGAAAGLLAPLGPLAGAGPFADLLLTSCAQFPGLAVELEDASGIKVGYEQTGALRVVRNPKRIAHLKKRLQAWQPLGLRVHWLDGDEARRLEPLLAPDICAAVYAPEEAQINAANLVRAFARAAANLGARIYSHTPVASIQYRGGRITSVRTAQGEEFSCSYLVLAAGAWSAQIAAQLDIQVPIRPLAGQMLALTNVGLRHILFGEGAYVIPRAGEVIVGATKEDMGFDAHVTPEGQEWLCAVAERLVPELRTANRERSWAGLRPSTPDTRPILGPVPDWSNLLLAIGHNSVGIMLSPITGQIFFNRFAFDFNPFSLERFAQQTDSLSL